MERAEKDVGATEGECPCSLRVAQGARWKDGELRTDGGEEAASADTWGRKSCRASMPGSPEEKWKEAREPKHCEMGTALPTRDKGRPGSP